MPLTPGDLLARRYRVVGELAPQDELSRWSAVDEATGAPVELCVPSAGSLLPPGARDFFELSWSAGLPTAGARAPVLDRFAWEGRPVGVRAPIQDLLPTEFTLDPGEALAWAAHLSPALSDPALSRGFDRNDLAIDQDGHPVWAPRGLVPRRSLAAGRSSVDPFATLMLDLLGVPPHDDGGRPAAVLLPSASPDLHSAIEAFRRGERPILPANPPGPVVRDRPAHPPSAQPPAAATTRTIASPTDSLRAHTQPPTLAVVLETAPTEAARLRIEALLDLEPGALERLQQASDLLIIGGGRTQGEAQSLVQRLHEVGVRARVAPVGAGASLVAPLAIAGVGIVFAVTLGLIFGALASLVGGLVSVIAAIAAFFRPRAELDYGRTSLALRNLHQPLREDGLTPALRSLQAARKQVLQLDLPEPARNDLLDSLQDLQHSLPTHSPGPAEPAEARAVRLAAQELIAGITSVQQPSPVAEASQHRARAAIAALNKGLT